METKRRNESQEVRRKRWRDHTLLAVETLLTQLLKGEPYGVKELLAPVRDKDLTTALSLMILSLDPVDPVRHYPEKKKVRKTASEIL